MRRNIFEIITQNNDISFEVERIKQLTEDDCLIRYLRDYSFFEFFEDYCFDNWKHRGHCVDFVDLLSVIDIDDIKEKAHTDEEYLITYIEFVCNVIRLSIEMIENLNKHGKQCQITEEYILLKRIINDLLSQYNQKEVYFKDEEKVIIVEDKPEATAVAEIVKEELVYPIIKYNHRTLKGDLEKKKQILRDMGNDLEPKRTKLLEINRNLSISIFYMLNNLNIRHNNVSKGESNYKEYVANMSPDKFEEWYDELYQMMLLAYLMLDNVDRKKRFDDLKKDIEGAGNGQAENAQ